MTQEQKELLLKDLCARLPYGVKIELMPITRGKCTTLTPIILYDYYISDDVNYLPYLFPLSSMTEEQKIECFKGTPLEIDKYGNVAVKDDFYGNSQYTDLEIYLEVIDWFNKNHFDYRGLIAKGLAIDATNLNIY
jgi:hypothetical protein